MFGKLMSISDELMWRYYELLSFRPMAEIERFKNEVAQGANPRDIKARLAAEIVTRFHGVAAAKAAEAGFARRFRDGELPETLPEVTVKTRDGALPIANALKEAGLTPSTSDALRQIGQGAVRLDGERVSDKSLALKAGQTCVVQVGKRRAARIRVL